MATKILLITALKLPLRKKDTVWEGEPGERPLFMIPVGVSSVGVNGLGLDEMQLSVSTALRRPAKAPGVPNSTKDLIMVHGRFQAARCATSQELHRPTGRPLVPSGSGSVGYS